VSEQKVGRIEFGPKLAPDEVQRLAADNYRNSLLMMNIDPVKLAEQRLILAQQEAEHLRAQNERLRAALKAVGNVMWMAEKYAEGSGANSLEWAEYTTAVNVFIEARAALKGEG
jgi:hypothetical protein